MTDTQRENPSASLLSAGMDGALPADELRFLLRRLDHDTALKQAWARYHVVGDSLRHQLPPLASAGFAERVMQAIEQESAAAERPRWLRWSAGGAIAASVAVAALMIAQPAGSGGDRDQLQVVTASPRDAADNDTSTGLARSDAPAIAAPRGVNAYADSPLQLTQQAAATRYGEGNSPLYSGARLSPYQLPRYRINRADGSYLLLIHPDQAHAANQASASAQ